MKYAVLFSSHSGNTEQVAATICQTLGKEACIAYGSWQDVVVDADVIFVGSWINKGNFDTPMLEVLRGLHHKKIALFGTAGFGGSTTYFDTILQRVKESIPVDNTILGSFMCQGKMPNSVRTRYEAMLAKQPQDETITAMLENFEYALAHPNEQDLHDVKAFAQDVITKLTLASSTTN